VSTIAEGPEKEFEGLLHNKPAFREGGGGHLRRLSKTRCLAEATWEKCQKSGSHWS